MLKCQEERDRNEQEFSASMGMYTELVLACTLKKDTPQEVLNLLRFMCGGERAAPKPADENLPAHPLFRAERWQYVLRSASYYFPGEPYASLRAADATGLAYLTVRSNLKNYDFEIEYFLHWLAPYSESAGFVGYSRYEESLQPRLIFFADGKARLQMISDESLSSGLDLDEFLADMDDDEEESANESYTP